MPTTKYACEKCDAEVKRGEKYCHECGVKLEWPEEEQDLRPVKAEAKKAVVIDNDEVDNFINTTLGGGVAMIFFCVLGLFLGPAVLIRRSAIKSRMADGRVIKNEKDRVLKHLKAIKIDATIANVLTWIDILVSLSRAAQLATTENSFGHSSTDTGSFIVYAILFVGINVIGIAVTSSIKKKASAAISSLES